MMAKVGEVLLCVKDAYDWNCARMSPGSLMQVVGVSNTGRVILGRMVSGPQQGSTWTFHGDPREEQFFQHQVGAQREAESAFEDHQGDWR